MSLLLARKKALSPYYIDKLNLRISSVEELCYVIYHYPLIAADGLISPEFLRWMDESLGEHLLVSRIAESLRHRDSAEITLALFLQHCDYYTQAEINGFRQRMREYRRLDAAGFEHAAGCAYFRAGRYHAALDKFRKAAALLDERMFSTDNAADKTVFQKRKADYYCDMAVIHLRMFEDSAAEELLITSGMICKNQRAERMKALAGFPAELPTQEQNAVLQELLSVQREAGGSDLIRKLESMNDCDRVKYLREAGTVLRGLKSDFRKHS